jgi:pyruvate/2-oxoglutarate/acetoin dehydrogenase E1 component
MYSDYHKTIREEMNKLAEIKNTIFLGQQVSSESMYSTLDGISQSKRREMPVSEDLQLGVSIGLALEGYLPISIYQRMDFLPRAADQLINHLNLFKEMSRGMYNPKVIIRTTIGTNTPMDVGPQHKQDLTEMWQCVLNFPVVKVTTIEEVKEAYELARKIDSSILIIEEQSKYYV